MDLTPSEPQKLDLQPVKCSTYPPVPYPSCEGTSEIEREVQSEDVVQGEQRLALEEQAEQVVMEEKEMQTRSAKEDEAEKSNITETPTKPSLSLNTPKPKPTFRTPFKPPRPIRRRRSPSPLRTSSPAAPSSPLAPAFSCLPLPPQLPRSRPSTAQSKFTPLRRASRSSGSPSSGSGSKQPSPAVQLSQLERKVHTLRQAVKYQRATLEGDGTKEDEGALEGLCERWKEAGRAAAELLWEHAGAMLGAGGGGGGGGGLSDSAVRGNDGGGGWSFTWGFANSPSSFSTSNSSPFSSNWGFADPPSSHFPPQQPSEADLLATFNHRVAEEIQLSGKSRGEVLRELEMEEDEMGALPSLEGLVKVREGGKRRKVDGALGQGRKKRKGEIEDEQEESSDEEMLRELDEMIGTASALGRAREVETTSVQQELEVAMLEDESKHGDDEVEEQQAWNVGKLMAGVGIDPSLFGWDADEEEFVA